jgi:hypothetical protein
MSELLVRTALPDQLEPKPLKKSNHLPRLQDREVAHR